MAQRTMQTGWFISVLIAIVLLGADDREAIAQEQSANESIPSYLDEEQVTVANWNPPEEPAIQPELPLPWYVRAGTLVQGAGRSQPEWSHPLFVLPTHVALGYTPDGRLVLAVGSQLLGRDWSYGGIHSRAHLFSVFGSGTADMTVLLVPELVLRLNRRPQASRIGAFAEGLYGVARGNQGSNSSSWGQMLGGRLGIEISEIEGVDSFGIELSLEVRSFEPTETLATRLVLYNFGIAFRLAPLF